ncbi:MAG: hypothetical protein EB020_13280, partial [Proteobacteria bacterium]|nr:hypothetical protein [Pseudomonadota bacterium]
MAVPNREPGILYSQGQPGSESSAPVPTRQYVFIQVDTDEGITGWGEITTYPGPV